MTRKHGFRVFEKAPPTLLIRIPLKLLQGKLLFRLLEQSKALSSMRSMPKVSFSSSEMHQPEKFFSECVSSLNVLHRVFHCIPFILSTIFVLIWRCRCDDGVGWIAAAVLLANRLENIHLIASCVVQCFSCFTNHGCFRLFPLEHWTLSLPIGVECLQKFSKAFEHSYTYLQLCFELFSDKNWWDADWFSLDRGPVPFQRSPNLLEKKKNETLEDSGRSRNRDSFVR